MPVLHWHTAAWDLQAGWKSLARTLSSQYLGIEVRGQEMFESHVRWAASFAPHILSDFEWPEVEDSHVLMLVSMTNVDSLEPAESVLVIEQAHFIRQVRWERVPGTALIIPNRPLEDMKAIIAGQSFGRVQKLGTPGTMFMVSDDTADAMISAALGRRALMPA